MANRRSKSLLARAARRRRVGPIIAAALAAAAIVGVSPGNVGVTPAAAAPGAATCTEVSGSTTTTWKVEYNVAPTTYGDAASVTGLKKSVNGGAETDATGQDWELRYDRLPWDYPAAGWSPPADNPAPFTSVTASTITSSGLGRPVVLYLSPRLVTPDGACTVYIAPFGWGADRPERPKVAVLGDDLLHQLNDSTANVSATQGYVQQSLSALDIRMEVEGHGAGPAAGQLGRRWTEAAGTTNLAKADTSLMDEFRGLLEHDLDGVVIGLGLNDALYAAAGADQAARDARWQEVVDKLLVNIAEVNDRSECAVVVTTPQNASSLDPEYVTYAASINDLMRWTATVGAGGGQGELDGWNLVDFAADAAGHEATDPQPWFTSDDVHLNAAGTQAYTKALTKAAQLCADSVVLWGKAGTLDRGDLAGRAALPSGEAFNTRSSAPVDWEAGKSPWFGAVGADGTVFNMTVRSAGNLFTSPTGDGATVSALQPDAGTFTNIKIKTDRGKTAPLAPDNSEHPDDADTDPDSVAGEGLDVEAINGGNGIAFTLDHTWRGQPLENCGPEDTACGGLEAQGQYPVVGVLTKGASGQWGVAEGAGWRNSWSPRELAAATIAADPVNGPAMVDAVCPVQIDFWGQVVKDPSGEVEVRYCRGASEIAELPSGDLVIAHYYAGISVIDLSAPDAAGKITARIAATYTFGPIDDPSWPDALSEPDPYLVADGGPCAEQGFPSPPMPPAEADRKVELAPREVQSDPTSPLSDQRFALGSDGGAYRYVADQNEANHYSGCVGQVTINVPIIEFSYDPNGAWSADPAQNQRLKPVSAPIFTGETKAHEKFPDAATGKRAFSGSGQFEYDHRGNLWIGTQEGVKVFTKKAAGRSLTSAPCVESGTAFEAYAISAAIADAAGARRMWGKVCPADYLILQPKTAYFMFGIEEDPRTHDMVAYGWPSTKPIPIRTIDPGDDGLDVTFEVGHIADPIAQWVDNVDVSGPCAADPATTCTEHPRLQGMQGPIDASGRSWYVIGQSAPRGTIKVDSQEMLTRDFDQWFVSFDVSRLMGRGSVQLTPIAGRSSVLQAERPKTRSTTKVDKTGTGALRVADWHVESDAGVTGCATCSDGAATPLAKGGLALGRDGGGGVPAGTSVTYEITVPKGGNYQLSYRAFDTSGTDAKIRMTVDGGTPRAPVAITNTSLGNPVVDAATLTLSAGKHTIVLSSPDASSAGWVLDWIKFTRQ